MNIHQAVSSKLDIETIVDSYYAIILIPGTQTVFNPVDFRLNKGDISVPLKPQDIYFKYKIDKNKKDIHYATVVLDRYYPEGTVINIKGINMTVSYYDSPFFKPCDNKYIALHCTVPADYKDEMNETLLKDSHEMAAKREIETILIANDRLKHLLPYYSYNWLNYTSDYIDPYQNFEALKKLYEIFIAERSEYEYKINDFQYFMSDNSVENIKDVKDKYDKFLKQVNYEKMYISYYSDVYILFNTISILKWFLFNKNFDKDCNITIKGHYQHPCNIVVKSDDTVDTTLSITTPKCAVYNYEIVCKNVVRCNVNNAYYDYTMNNVIVYAINKSNNLKIELINLTGMDSTNYNVSSTYRIKPAYLNCEYAPYNCINGLPAWMINWWETTTRHIGEHVDSESNIDIIDYSSYNDTFFVFVCEVLRYICTSQQIYEKYNEPECVHYYADLNANLIKLFAEFKNELDPEELFVENEEEFYNRYHALLDKKNEDITLNDIIQYASAKQELDYITSLNSVIGSNNIDKFSNIYTIDELDDSLSTCKFTNNGDHEILSKFYDGDLKTSVNSDGCMKTIIDFGKYGANISQITIYGSDGHSDEIVAVAGNKNDDNTFEDFYDTTFNFTKVLRTNGSSQNEIPIIVNEWNKDTHKYSVNYSNECRYVIIYRSANTPSNISEIQFTGYLNSIYRDRLDEIRGILNTLFKLDGSSMVVKTISDLEILDKDEILNNTVIKVLNDGTNHFRYFKYIDGEFETIDYIYLKDENNEIENAFIIPETTIEL